MDMYKKQIRRKKNIVEDPPIILTEHDHICTDYIEGLSTIKIAVKYNKCYQSITNILHRNGVPLRSKRNAALIRHNR